MVSHLMICTLQRLIVQADGDDSSPDAATGLREGNATLLQMAPSIIKSIMTPDDQEIPRLECPQPDGSRYDYLQFEATAESGDSRRRKYFFAIDLHENIEVLPRLLGSVVESLHYLGPQNCVVSILEGRSDDGTFEVLKLLHPEIENLGTKYFFGSSDIDPYAKSSGETSSHRILALSQLRNLALAPLLQESEDYLPNTTVIFLNDVALCTEDILELVHQRHHQEADMTCAMDWTYVGPDPTFYDVWVARGMNGDSFFEIPPDGNWNSAWNLFWNNPTARNKLNAGQPFQVFSCWNGATAFTATPLREGKVKFRSTYEGECSQGEPQLFCKDMWYHGFGKIAVVPAVNLEYSNDAAKKIKDKKGFTSRWVNGIGDESDRIEWEGSPPPQIKCIANYENQTWVQWDELLKEHEILP